MEILIHPEYGVYGVPVIKPYPSTLVTVRAEHKAKVTHRHTHNAWRNHDPDSRDWSFTCCQGFPRANPCRLWSSKKKTVQRRILDRFHSRLRYLGSVLVSIFVLCISV